MKKKRKILAVTGARSEYDIISPVLDKMRKDSLFEVSVLVTGSHLSENFGKTIFNIEEDGFVIEDKVFNLINTDEKIGRIISLGNQIPGLAQAFSRIKPDIILVVGDREEAISVSLTGAYMDIPVAHFCGGDIAKDGYIDNSVRYAASKFAHIHFPVLSQHKETLLRLGEDDWRIFTVGNPALDKFISTPHLSKEEISSRLNFNISSEHYVVLIQHPISSQGEEERINIRKTLDAIIEFNVKCLINYPNSDAGNFSIVEAYQDYVKKYPQLFLFKNLDRETYVNILRHASCLIGNSSSGLIEAPSLGLPAINVGLRQRGRFSGNNVIFVDNDKEQINKALSKSLEDEEYRAFVKSSKNPYGDGNSSEKIVKVLKNIEINNKLIYKNITY